MEVEEEDEGGAVGVVVIVTRACTCVHVGGRTHLADRNVEARTDVKGEARVNAGRITALIRGGDCIVSL